MENAEKRKEKKNDHIQIILWGKYLIFGIK